jgi:hypothetical protein
MRKNLGASETWFWKMILKIKWTDTIRNEEVYRRIGEERT